eukprot:Nk52_evm27s2462 gene=Nk52_evmTU27s2462
MISGRHAKHRAKRDLGSSVWLLVLGVTFLLCRCTSTPSPGTFVTAAPIIHLPDFSFDEQKGVWQLTDEKKEATKEVREAKHLRVEPGIPTDVCLAVSVYRRSMLPFIRILSQSLNLGQDPLDDRFALVQYSRFAQKRLRLYEGTNREEVEMAIKRFHYLRGEADHEAALRSCAEELLGDGSKRLYSNARRVIVLLTEESGGFGLDAESLLNDAEWLQKENVNVVVVEIKEKVKPKMFEIRSANEQTDTRSDDIVDENTGSEVTTDGKTPYLVVDSGDSSVSFYRVVDESHLKSGAKEQERAKGGTYQATRMYAPSALDMNIQGGLRDGEEGAIRVMKEVVLHERTRRQASIDSSDTSYESSNINEKVQYVPEELSEQLGVAVNDEDEENITDGWGDEEFLQQLEEEQSPTSVNVQHRTESGGKMDGSMPDPGDEYIDIEMSEEDEEAWEDDMREVANPGQHLAVGEDDLGLESTAERIAARVATMASVPLKLNV